MRNTFHHWAGEEKIILRKKMTPKQKAEKLVEQYKATEVSVPYMDLEGDISIARNNMLIESACQCALHCVEEIDKVLVGGTPKDDPYANLSSLEYWQEVRNEILIIASA